MGPIQGAITRSSQQFSLDDNRRKKSPQSLCCAGLVDFIVLQTTKKVVELAGVEPASEIPTSSVLHA